MNIIGAQSVQDVESESELNEKKYVFSEHARSKYSVIFEGSSFTGGNETLVITVKNRREVELLLMILGEDVSVILDETVSTQHPEVLEWLSERTYTEVLAELKWTYREAEEVSDIVQKIPLPQNLEDHQLRIYNDDSKTERLNPAYVHKVNNNNVLISKPYQCGNMLFFKGFTKSPEFNIDHSSDHMEGIIIFEAARQAGIAASHLSGIPFSSRIVLLKTIINYKKFVETHQPYVIHTIPVVRIKGSGSFYVAFSIVQNGNICASGYLTGLQYQTNESYQKHRVSKNFNGTAEEAVGM